MTAPTVEFLARLRVEVGEPIDRYALETDGGARIGVRNVGIRVGSAADIAAIIRGEPVPADRIYFRTQPRFSTASPEHAWLNERLFVARGFRTPDAVSLEVYVVD